NEPPPPPPPLLGGGVVTLTVTEAESLVFSPEQVTVNFVVAVIAGLTLLPWISGKAPDQPSEAVQLVAFSVPFECDSVAGAHCRHITRQRDRRARLHAERIGTSLIGASWLRYEVDEVVARRGGKVERAAAVERDHMRRTAGDDHGKASQLRGKPDVTHVNSVFPR